MTTPSTAAATDVQLSVERTQAAAPLVEAMRQADRALIALALTQPPSGPDPEP